MKLIGATDFLVRSPFVVEGILIGLIGSAIPLGLLSVIYGKICAYIANKFSFIGNMMTFIPTKEIFSTLVPVALILGVGIGFWEADSQFETFKSIIIIMTAWLRSETGCFKFIS